MGESRYNGAESLGVPGAIRVASGVSMKTRIRAAKTLMAAVAKALPTIAWVWSWWDSSAWFE
jgi:hypothetical protein